jgi:hypothetical protein
MKKIISFSLWGNNPKYTQGAIRNAELAPEIYPEWICRYYIGKSTPQEIIDELKSKSHVEVVMMDEEGDWTGMFWRFQPISNEDTEIMISRDCDSRLSIREKECVDEFINSDKMFHTMIDHPWHGGIMGGMWGAKKGILSDIKKLMDEWPKGDFWQTDQQFLNNIVSPIVANNILIHDSINQRNFPTKRDTDFRFVGEIYDGADNRQEHWCVLTFPEFKHLLD